MVEDDAFTQQTIVKLMMKAVHAMMPHASVDIETSETAAGALAR